MAKHGCCYIRCRVSTKYIGGAKSLAGCNRQHSSDGPLYIAWPDLRWYLDHLRCASMCHLAQERLDGCALDRRTSLRRGFGEQLRKNRGFVTPDNMLGMQTIVW